MTDMTQYPPRVVLGEEPYQTIYELKTDQLLLDFEKDFSKQQIDDLLKKLESKPVFEPMDRTGPDGLSPTMRWVKLQKRPESLDQFAQILLKQHSNQLKLVCPVYYAEGKGPESAVAPVPGTLLVRFKEGAEDKGIETIRKEFKLEHDPIKSKLLEPFYKFTLVSATGETSGDKPRYDPFRGEPSETFNILEKILEIPMVDVAEMDWLNFKVLEAVPNDTFWANQWNMARISMVEAWDEQTGDPSICIAVIDTGCDLTHPDLAFTPNTAPNLTHYNAEEAISDPPPYNASPKASYINGAHGSLVAGLAAATMNNNAGVSGVAGGCQIMPLRIFPAVTSYLAEAINWARNNNADVINMSLSWSTLATVTTALNNAWNAGIVLCAASGNYYSATEPTSAPVKYPARHANVIAIGASDQNDQRKRPASADGEEWGSHYGADLDVVAPGQGLWSTDIQGADGWNDNNGGNITWFGVNYASSGDATGDYFALMGGTSGACPHVAGLAALLLIKFPGLTNQQVRDIIEQTCDKVSAGLYPYAHDPNRPNGTWHEQMGYGRINAARAMCEAHWVALGVQPIEMNTPELKFIDIPEEQQTGRAVVFIVRSCLEYTFEIIDGPTVTSGPPGTAFTALNTSVTLESLTTSPTPRQANIWILYTGTNDGDSATGTLTVRCVETEDEWVIPISANTVSKPKVASVLTLDKSGSMDWASGIPDKIRMEILKYSSPIFVNHLDEDDAMGIVSFSADDNTAMTVNQAGPHFSTTRGDAITTINGLLPETTTAIGDGLETSHNILQPVTGYDFKTIVVFTDGHETDAKYISDVQHLINERVFAIGLGTAEVVQPVALKALTDSHDGYLVMTDELGTNDYLRLLKYFLQILAGVTNADIVVDPEACLKPGQDMRIPFKITEADYRFEAVLISLAPYAFKFYLETPEGNIIDPGTATSIPDILFITHDNEAFYQIPIPLGMAGIHEGTWHAVLIVDDSSYKKYLDKINKDTYLYRNVAVHGIRYNLNVLAHSNLNMRVNLSQNSYEPGAELTLRSTITQYGVPLKSRANIDAYLERSDGTETVLNLIEIEPGVFESKLSTAMSGVYKFQVKGYGTTFKGVPFTREQYITGAVWKGGDNPPPSSKDDQKETICKLLYCILNEKTISKKFEKKLLELGINLEAIRKCIFQYCKIETSRSTITTDELNKKLKNSIRSERAKPINKTNVKTTVKKIKSETT